ncbi:MAG TPA: CAP domain-containing protein [Chloroflexota bacterium]|nr:CAP domain-containing protein [Chloroflexota bacterium]
MLTSVAAQPIAAADLAGQLPGDRSFGTVMAVEQAMLELTNADRLANGLSPLDFDPETLAIARQRAASQLGTPALSHYDANGDLAFVNMLASAQVGYQLAGENLARASADDATVTDKVEQALMKSPTHRKNILETSFSRVSIGAASDGQGQITIAEVYRN